MITPENILLTPLWLNQDLQLPIKRSWKDKGILVVGDMLDRNRCALSQEVFENTYQVKTNFLEYGAFCIKVTNYLGYRDIADGSLVSPCNSYLNVILNKDKKGVTNLYKQLMGKNYTIIEKACNNWSEKIENRISPFSMRESFSKITMVDI